MKKLILCLIFVFNVLNAYEIIDKENIYTVKIENKNFDSLLAKLKDEINFQSFIIVNELNLGKSLRNVGKALEDEVNIKKAINLLMCKPSFTFEMNKENIENITYCPLGISIYQNKENIVFISFKKYKKFNKKDKIADKINEKLKALILNSLRTNI